MECVQRFDKCEILTPITLSVINIKSIVYGKNFMLNTTRKCYGQFDFSPDNIMFTFI